MGVLVRTQGKQLFLSVYVDDYKMAGKKENITPMWEKLRKQGFDIEPPTKFHDSTYLGCQQFNIEPPVQAIKTASLQYTELLTTDTLITAEGNLGETQNK